MSAYNFASLPGDDIEANEGEQLNIGNDDVLNKSTCKTFKIVSLPKS